ncbi:MAG: plasmid mobilization relaxosome protein MobC [Firmicutes bacterium]|nr:plasmid mobilization relaxosome protein MobC [Bacillota bacterium]
MKDRTFAFRISEQDYRLLRSKATRGKVTMTDLILHSVKDKEIVVVQGLPEAMAEMKALGRNLNRLTTLCNMGRITCPRLDNVQRDFAALLVQICALGGEGR